METPSNQPPPPPSSGATPPSSGGTPPPPPVGGPQPAGSGPGPSGGFDTSAAMASGTNFFGKLMDRSFSEFITPTIVRVIYTINLVVAGLFAVLMLISGLTQGGLAALLGFVVAPLMFLFWIVYSRIFLELVMLLFRIEENTRSK